MSRHAERIDAIEILYAADLRGISAAEVLDERQTSDPVGEYAAHLVRIVERDQAEIDAMITRKLIGWRIERMSPVDRNVVRVGIAELWAGEIPKNVAMNEAIESARHFSGDKAAKFVNGVLAAVLAEGQPVVDG